MPAYGPLPSPRRRARVSWIALILAAGLAGEALAQAQPVAVPPGALDQALLAVAAQTGHQLLFTPDLVAGRRTPGLRGAYTPEAAVTRLLADDRLLVERVGPRTLAVRRRPAAAESSRPFAAEATGDLGGAGDPVAMATAEATAAPATGPALLEEVLVTGTNIRGGRSASPLVTLDAEDLLRAGRGTVAEALQALPQNFAGEASEGAVLTRADRTGTNSGYGAGINLRGLGADATLVLVNGRRLAGSGAKADFADISGIPSIAVSRVEVLLDGASAVYGSDAVGGVVNIHLRRDLDGGEVRVRAGSAGTPREAQAGLIVGRTWTGGGAVLAYEAYVRERLAADDRRFAASADLRPLGGSDRRETLAFPGNILRADPATGVLLPYWAIPTGQDGTNLRPGDLRAGAQDLSSPQAGSDLLPQQRRQSLYASVRHELSDTFELNAEARGSVRRAKARGLAQTATLTVGRANPFFVSPTGAASHQLQYSFQGELPNPVAQPVSQSLSATAGFRWRWPRDWLAEGYVAFGEDILETRTGGLLNTGFLAEALGNAPDNPATAYRAAVDGYFNPFTGRPANPSAALAFIGSGTAATRVRGQVRTAAAQADGPVLALPGGDLRLAFGVQAREEAYRRGGSNFTSGAAPTPQGALDIDRSVAGVFIEARAPLAGGDRRPGLEGLELTGALRAERYSDFGWAVTPKLGLVYAPMAGVRVRATYGESFRAPALQELGEAEIYTPLRLQQGAARVLTLALNGGNPDLEPETAKTWTAGVDLEPAAAPGLRISAGWFRTDFQARIDRPLFGNRLTALTDPALAVFVRRLTPSDAADLALITGLLADPRTTTALGVFPASEYAAITDYRYVNTGRLVVSGLDVQAAYGRPLGDGRLTLAANATRLLTWRQQVTPIGPERSYLGLAGYPARTRARVSADWARGGLSLGVSASYVGGFRDALGARIADQATVDALARYTAPAASRWAGVSASLHVRNLFDQAPPFYDNPLGYGFDPASGDPVGRFVALTLSRSW